MRILYCIEGIYNSGGMERIIIEKANYLQTHGFEVAIVTSNNRNRKSFFQINKSITLIELNINYDFANSSNLMSRIIKKLNKRRKHKYLLEDVVYKFRPDVIISTFGDEIEFITKMNIPKNIKIIAEIHFSYQYRVLNSRDTIHKIFSRFQMWKYNNLIKKLDAFVCLTSEDSIKWNNTSNLLVIPNFISHVQESQAELNNKRVIAFGRLYYQKGFDRLLKAWTKVVRQYPDWTLDIYGDGELEADLTKLANKLSISSSVFFHKPVIYVEKELINSSIYVLSSRFEGLPMVLLEAMSCGLPIVSFDCPCGPSDLINNYNCGILVKDGDIEKFSKSIIELIENKKLRVALGKNAYNGASDFIPEKVMPMWINLFYKLIENKL